MDIFFRADASEIIGTGHVMRCLTLAEELKQHGVNINFVCREEAGNLNGLIEQGGFRVHPLPANLDWVSDRVQTQKIIESQSRLPEWLVIDHYDIDIVWESSFRGQVRKIMVIDDLANRQHDCDILLDQNYNLDENRYQGLLSGQCMQLLGSEYALLRVQFRKIKERLHTRSGKVKRIMVFMGGADPSNETCKVLRGIQMINCPDIAIDVVIGASNIHAGEVESLAAQISNVVCHNHVENMAELMVASDLSVGASGTTTWERCSVGLPSLVIITANNQKDIAGNLGNKGIVINLGWFEDVTDKDIACALESLLDKPDIIRRMSHKSMDVVDTLGTERVARELKCQMAE